MAATDPPLRNPVLPTAQTAMLDGRGAPIAAWMDFFRDVRTRVNDDATLQAEIDAILVRLETIENGSILGLNSVITFGSLSDGLVTIMLNGDVPTPDPLSYYGTGPDGTRGFYPATSLVEYLVDESGNYLVDQDGNYLVGYDITSDLFALVGTSYPGIVRHTGLGTWDTLAPGTTAQFLRGDNAWSNTLLATANPALTLDRTNDANNSNIELKTTASSVWVGRAGGNQGFCIGYAADMTVTANRAYNVNTTGGHIWYTGGAGTASSRMTLGTTGTLSINGSGGTVEMVRDGTNEATFRMRNATANSGGDVRGMDAGGLKLTSVNGTDEFMRLQIAAVTVNETGLDLDFRVEGDSISHLLFTDATSTTENVAFVTTAAPNWQSMNRGLFIGNASTIPTGNPTAGVFLFADAGAAKIRGSGGTVTTFGPADPHCPICESDYVSEFDNPKYGYLATCHNCAANGINSHTRVRGAWKTHKD